MRRDGSPAGDGALRESYGRWRASELGRITEAIEEELILELTGPLDGRRVLDVGCGDGSVALACAERGARVTGVDRSEAALAAARRRANARRASLTLLRADAQHLPFHDGAFDVVIAVTLLCLVDDAPRAVREMARVVAPGGLVVIGELGRWSTWAAWRRVRGWVGHPVWRRARFHDARGLERIARTAGLEVERTEGAVHYPPFALAARLCGPHDRALGRLGAAFLALAARRPDSSTRQNDGTT